MEAAANQNWFLRKHEDGTVFGPLSFAQLQQWASAAQIAPHDKLSTDQRTWQKAPMYPELQMDWLVEVTSEHYYGPTTIGAIAEFVRLGEITEETFIINSCDGTRRPINEVRKLLEQAQAEEQAQSALDSPLAYQGPAATGMAINLRERINVLEQLLQEERRAFQESEERYQELEARYNELLRHSAGEGSPS
jgi:DNA-binding transcriptional MerR regulator